MKREEIIIANLKCGGCASTIKNKLTEIPGVQSVTVDDEKDLVIIEHSGLSKREDYAKKLYELGYPEATRENGLLLKLKSYASCVAGRIDNMTN